eukprot:7420947-Ditylum_brightwellii.AAC.1
MECANFAAACLESNNFGVGVVGGSHFVAFTIITEYQKPVFRSKKQIKDGNIPTKCLLSLDLKNMFNTMSQEKCRKILSKKFPNLLCLFDALYKRANKVHVRKEDDTLETFLQFEGFAQGCPLSGVFSASVLGDLLKHLNEGQSDHSLCATNPQDDVDNLIS